MSNHESRLKIAAQLHALKLFDQQGHTQNLSAGICCFVSAFYLKEHFLTWEHYSGQIVYPVPGDNGPESAIDAYYANLSNLWADNTYCNLRRNLLDHLIKQFPTPASQDVETERLAFIEDGGL